MKLSRSKVSKICQKIKEEMVSYSFLAKGNHNENYLVETDKSKYILRIENNSQFKNLRKEYGILKRLKPGIGPKVYVFDSSHKIIGKNYILEEFIQGEHPAKKANDKFVITMAKWLKKLHTIEVPYLKKYSILSALRPYQGNFLRYNHVLDERLGSELKELFSKCIKICRKHDKIFENRKKISLLHRDVSRGNVLIKGNDVRLIDWEFASYGFPEWDLVYFLQSYELKKYHNKLFLDTYGYPKTNIAKRQMALVSILNVCGAIGYSVWRLGLIEERKVNKGERDETLARLRQDTKLLHELVRKI